MAQAEPKAISSVPSQRARPAPPAHLLPAAPPAHKHRARTLPNSNCGGPLGLSPRHSLPSPPSSPSYATIPRAFVAMSHFNLGTAAMSSVGTMTLHRAVFF